MPVNERPKDGSSDILFRRLDCAVINFTIGTLNKQDPSLSFQTVAQLKRLQELGIVDAKGALTPRYGGRRRAAKKKPAR